MRISRIALLLAALGLSTAAASFAVNPAFVSTKGSDTRSCKINKPCKSLQRALNRVDAGGTIIVLDSGVFSKIHLDIRKAVTIQAAPGVVAKLVTPSFAAVSVNARLSDVVVLRGLTFDGEGSGSPTNAIVLNRAEALHVEDCVVSGFSSKGILSLSLGELYVLDSVFRNNYIGISLDTRTTATLDNVRLEDGSFGLFASFGANASVQNSVASGNSFAGFSASEGSGGVQTEINIEDSMASNNNIGVEARGVNNDIGIVRISDSIVTGNTTGMRVGAGAIYTRGNNTVSGNGLDVNGALIPLAPK